MAAATLTVFIRTRDYIADKDAQRDAEIAKSVGARYYTTSRFERIIAAVLEDEDLRNVYAGCYIAHDGVRVIKYVGDAERLTAFMTHEGLEEDLRYLEVKANLETLGESYESLGELLGLYGIQAIGLNTRDNIVEVTLTTWEYLADIKRAADCRAAVFVLADPDMAATFT